ncbi:Pimeloyl-ACP methyl ester carboxylesterase [Asanoa hainanensis]|uniref:Pimeloyl-ACP methyl ester carboxylesterase n=1 Tax=Asanoa hainanensis TaxID=560556 RepID=A0A239MQ53_9ACTN|nr:alpha/beta hydrolase [Asanoa hainanensis]SNT44383.1 Pimeloyl-ACP methyl ester carboxylesterase [Asanoa hainanensis]
MPELLLPVGDATLCAETFGAPGDPAVLLLGGAASSMDFWAVDFCASLAAAGRFVIRYDNRDTGRSTNYPAGQPGYTGMQLTSDAVGVLDALGIARAHLVGVSMGGGVSQELAVTHPDRVASITLIATSGALSRPSDAPPLPPPAERIQALFTAGQPAPDWTDRAAAIDRVVADLATFGGSVTLSPAEARSVVATAFDRTTDFAASQTNHWILEQGPPSPYALADIAVPTLVLHGTEDPFFPFPHGEALAREIPGARLVPMPGVGHEYPPRQVWPTVVPAIVAHTGG